MIDDPFEKQQDRTDEASIVRCQNEDDDGMIRGRIVVLKSLFSNPIPGGKARSFGYSESLKGLLVKRNKGII